MLAAIPVTAEKQSNDSNKWRSSRIDKATFQVQSKVGKRKGGQFIIFIICSEIVNKTMATGTTAATNTTLTQESVQILAHTLPLQWDISLAGPLPSISAGSAWPCHSVRVYCHTHSHCQCYKVSITVSVAQCWYHSVSVTVWLCHSNCISATS